MLRSGGVRIGAGGSSEGVPCVSVGGGECGLTLGDVVTVTATCVPRRLVLTSVLERRSTGLEVVLRDGRTIRARIVRLPASAGRRRLAVAVLAAPGVPARVVLRRGSARPATRALSLPAAARQCGYADLFTLGTSVPQFG